MLKINFFKYLKQGRKFLNDPVFLDTVNKSRKEKEKSPTRTMVINFLMSLCEGETKYLEIGVRNPEDNFNHINATVKYSVDPGLEYDENPVDFQMTSDEFFQKLRKGEVLSPEVQFDVIFIDGLHLAEQVDKDIRNSLDFLSPNGFAVLHDCNPPSEWHARESFQYKYTPAQGIWTGTTWKAFLKWRFNSEVSSCCIDTDWGLGIISKGYAIGNAIAPSNEFFEFYLLEENREAYLNLLSFEAFKKKVTRKPLQLS